MTIADAFNEITIAQGGTPNYSGTIASAIDALNDALAGSDQPAETTIEGAVRLLGQHIGGGGAQTTDVYLWNEDVSLGAHGVTAAKYMAGVGSFEELQFEGITTEFDGATIYGVKVKDVPAGARMLLTTVNGDFEPSIGYSSATFPPNEAIGPSAPMLIDGLYDVGSYNTDA